MMKIHYEKFKDLPKDIVNFPSLAAKVLLAVAALVFLVYIFLRFQ